MQKHFRIAVGLMLFLIELSQTDISNAVRELANVNYGATQVNFNKMLCSVKFVLDTHQKTLRFKPTENRKDNKLWAVYGYSYSDYTGDKETRVRVSGFCVFVWDV